MRIREAIRSAGSAGAICALLTDYLAITGLAGHVTTADIRGVGDVWSCFEELVVELETAHGPDGVPPQDAIPQAVSVFDGAIDRLSQVLDNGSPRRDAGHSSMHRAVHWEAQPA